MSKYRAQSEVAEPLSGINIIPVIDVSLVLLIILMATSPILNLPGFEVKLPKALTAESKEKNITISVGIKGQLAVNEAQVDMNTLVAAIQKELRDKKNFLVIIRADLGVAYGQVEQVMDIAKKAGATRIAIATQQDTDRLKKIMMTIDLALESTKRNEAISLTVATGLHVLMFLWNPTLLKSDFKTISDFVSVEVVESAGSPLMPEKPEKMSMLATLKDMLLTPKSEELSHVAPSKPVQPVSAPQPTLKEATRKPISMNFQPQTQNEDLAALKNPDEIKAPGAKMPTLPVGGPTLQSKSFGGIRAKDIPFQVSGQESISANQASNIPIAVGNTSAKQALDYTGPTLKESSNRRVGIVAGRSGTDASPDTMALATSKPAPIGTGGVGTAPSGAPTAPSLQEKSGGLVSRSMFGSGRGSGIGSGIEGMPSAAAALDNQLASSNASSKNAKGKGFEIAGPLTNRPISKKVIPEYPAWAEEQGIMGSVRLYFTVDAAGNVRSYIRVTKTTGYPALDQLGIEALKQWKFVPLSSGEEEKGQWGIITFNFSLSS